MTWAVGSVCAAFLCTVLMEIGVPVWSFRHPMLHYGVSGATALLWLPIPTVTAMLTGTAWWDGFTLFVVWGSVGFVLQATAYWLRMSHEHTISMSTHEWTLVGDRRYWELQHKSAEMFVNPVWSSVTSSLVYLWTIGFSLRLLTLPDVSGASSDVFSMILGIASTLGVLGCIAHLLSEWLPWFRARTKVLRMYGWGFSLIRIIVLGLVAGWVVISATVFLSGS